MKNDFFYMQLDFSYVRNTLSRYSNRIIVYFMYFRQQFIIEFKINNKNLRNLTIKVGIAFHHVLILCLSGVAQGQGPRYMMTCLHSKI